MGGISSRTPGERDAWDNGLATLREAEDTLVYILGSMPSLEQRGQIERLAVLLSEITGDMKKTGGTMSEDDEAWEAADIVWEIYNLAYRDDVPVVRAEKDAILAVHDAGVVEGIRQAREAAVMVAMEGIGYRAVDRVIQAIDDLTRD